MTARVPDGEQPVTETSVGYGLCDCLNPGVYHLRGVNGCETNRPRPAEPTVDGLAELEALRAVVARVEKLADELDGYVAARWRPKTGTYDDGVNRAQSAAAEWIRRALRGD